MADPVTPPPFSSTLASRGLGEITGRHPAIARRPASAAETERGLRPTVRLTRAVSATALPWGQIGTTRHFGRIVTDQVVTLLGAGYQIGAAKDEARSFFDSASQMLVSPAWDASACPAVATLLGFAELGRIAFESAGGAKVVVRTTLGAVAVQSSVLTFAPNAVLLVRWDPRAGSVEVTGATTGNGEQVDRPWRWSPVSRSTLACFGGTGGENPANFADATLGEIYGDDVDLT